MPGTARLAPADVSALEERFDVHGTPLRVGSRDPALRDLVSRYYCHFPRGAADAEEAGLAVDLRWQERLKPSKQATRLGHGVFAWPGGAHLEPLPGVTVHLHADADRGPWTVRAGFLESPVRTVARRLVHGGAATRSDRLNLLRMAVHYPLFMRFQLLQRMTVLHAAAVQRGGKALLVCGLNGVGKSTIGLACVKLFGFTLLSDNFTLTDGRRVCGFPEECRISGRTAELLDLDLGSTDKVHGKHQMGGSRYVGGLTAETAVVLFPRLVPEGMSGASRSLSPEVARMRLDALHWTTAEAPEFAGFAVASEHLFGDALTLNAAQAHGRLTEDVSCSELSVPFGPSTSLDTYAKLLEPIITEHF